MKTFAGFTGTSFALSEPNFDVVSNLVPRATLKWGSVFFLSVAIAIFVLFITGSTSGFLPRMYARYVSYLDRRLRRLFILHVQGKLIVFGQGVAFIFVLAVGAARVTKYWWVGIFLALFSPAYWLWKEQKKRFEKLEEQLDGFILALANALKTTPSIGSAFSSVLSVIPDPTRQEVDLALKEIRVGSTLEQALIHMAARIGSRSIDSALSAVLIGRQVGGNLPKILETTALSLREMRRLDGVIRTKTADAKIQLWIIGAVPFLFIFGLEYMWHGYFDNMYNFFGYVAMGIMGIMWVVAIFWARKILQVDY